MPPQKIGWPVFFHLAVFLWKSWPFSKNLVGNPDSNYSKTKADINSWSSALERVAGLYIKKSFAQTALVHANMSFA